MMECPWCKQRAARIVVHGHYQCSNCTKNVDECCQGEQCDINVTSTPYIVENYPMHVKKKISFQKTPVIR